MEFKEFSKKNLKRCQHPDGFNHPLHSWTRAEWFQAVLGELGEAANVAKKIKRIEQGIPGNDPDLTLDELNAQLAEEIADTFIYLDLLAQSQGIDLEEAVMSKFNQKSAEIGYTEPKTKDYPSFSPAQQKICNHDFSRGFFCTKCGISCRAAHLAMSDQNKQENPDN